MTLNPHKKFEIVEDLKVSFYIIVAVIVAFLIAMSVLTYNVISAGGASGIVVIAFIWPVSIIFLIIIRYVMRGLTKTRSFIINDQEIKITIPHRPEFQILWSEFESFQFKKRGMGKSRTYELIFTNKQESRSFRYRPGTDFKVRTRKKIETALEEWCGIKGKKFS